MRVRLCSIEEEFDYRTFDCVRLAQCFGEFDYAGVPNETAPQENRSTVFNQSGWEIRKPGVELAGKIRNEINPLLGV